MMLLSEALLGTDPAAPRIVAANDPEALSQVLDPAVSLAIWQRPSRPRDLFAALLDAAPFCAVAEDTPPACAGALAARLPVTLPPALARDIRRLATGFSLLIRSARVRVRLEGITGDGCCRFHADTVGLRLLCTYAGEGTEWLPLHGAAAARAWDPAAGPAPFRLDAGAVAILKGDGHPDAPGRGLVHRSPPMGPVPVPRLLLCLDEPGRIPTP